MHYSPSGRTKPAAAAVVAIAVALLLAACGGSSGSPTTTTTATAGTTVTPTTSPEIGTGTTSTGTTGTDTKTGTTGTTKTKAAAPSPHAGANKPASRPVLHASSVAACLQKAALKLRSSAPSAKGLRAGYAAAAKLCLGEGHVHFAPVHIPRLPGAPASAPKKQAPTGAQATAVLVRFAECLRHSGLNVPAPNTSGTGPVINLKGLDAKNQHTRAIVAKCQPKK